jgi:hypothetical protein
MEYAEGDVVSTEQAAAAGAEDALALVADLRALADQMPRLTVAAEFATLGPVLNAIVGGRNGVGEFREGVLLDEAAYIDRYREVFAALLADTPGRSALLHLVDLAIAQDHRENANLLAAFDLLDPDGADEPKVLAATRYAVPAAAHAAAKFALLLPPTVPAVARYLVMRVRANG